MSAAVRLRRGPLVRIASSNTQFVLALFLAGFVAIAVMARGLPGLAILVTSKAAIPLAVLAVPWLLGVTAWAHADDDGIRWRYWLPQRYSWDEITRITLTTRDLVFAPSGFNHVPTIVVYAHQRHGDHESSVEANIRPVEGGARYRRRFGTELVALAKAHGVPVVVQSNGWEQPLPDGAEESTWS